MKNKISASTSLFAREFLHSSPLVKRYRKSIPSPCEVDTRTDTVERARKYISKIDGAVAGESGHNLTFYVSNILVDKFKMNYDEAIELLLEYNVRCDPPWAIAELNHKIIDALAQVGKPAPENQRTDDGQRKTRTEHTARPIFRSALPFTSNDIVTLARLRRIPPQGIKLSADRGFLFKTLWHNFECFGVRDVSEKLIELRRMDGKLFPTVPSHGLDPRKSHAIRGSNKSWPLGILEAREFPAIALVEGIPDFLYAHYRVAEERVRDRVAVVTMLSASPAIDEIALKFFVGKTVRIFPHLDAAGLRGAKKWSHQLVEAGATRVDFFNLSGFQQRDGKPVNDLCDLTWLTPSDIKNKIVRTLP